MMRRTHRVPQMWHPQPLVVPCEGLPCGARPATRFRHFDGPCQCFIGGTPPEFPHGPDPATSDGLTLTFRESVFRDPWSEDRGECAAPAWSDAQMVVHDQWSSDPDRTTRRGEC